MITESLPQTQQEKLPFEVYLQNQLAEMNKTLAEKDKVIQILKGCLKENNISYPFD